MKPAHLGFAALAVLAATAGYAVHQYSARAQLERAQALAAPVKTLAQPSAPTALFDWSFADVAGKSQPLSQWRGKLVVLNFWATWCPPCLKEIPAFVELQQRLGGQGLQFVGIALDEVAAVEPFLKEHTINYPVLLGDQDVARFMTELGNQIGALPFTVVVGRDGKVLSMHQGEWHAEDAAKTLEGYLAGPAASGK
ncbi:MAG: TlpA family protein disulfide reductase [Gammaproteobacteria bacterium]|nr:TlpA family protein disulfide reductase [Gammaproteobacteria bacterium]